MSLHIQARPQEIAPTVLLPGDPLRAKFIAENFLQDVACYSQTRNMLGFTGIYRGEKVSVQGTGMGLPSLGIYVNELIDSFNVQKLIRVGSCGSYRKEIQLRDVVLAMSASCESNFLQRTFNNMNYAPSASFHLLRLAYEKAKSMSCSVHVGNILSADVFYNPDQLEWKKWAEHGVLGVEMESAMLYSLAARKERQALSVLTVSDSFITGESTSPDEREKSFSQMIEIALGCV